MTIISKEDSAYSVYRAALDELVAVMATQRGSKATRECMQRLYEQAKQTNRCVYCGEDLALSRSSRHVEACRTCGSRVDRLLAAKSRLSKGGTDRWDLQLLQKNYNKMPTVPPSLRGASGDVSKILEALDKALQAEKGYKAARLRRIGAEAAKHEQERRRQCILEELVHFGADPDSEETQQRIEEIYWDRYTD